MSLNSELLYCCLRLNGIYSFLVFTQYLNIYKERYKELVYLKND